MALTATMHTFDVQLADVDRHVYADFSLRMARHPSETVEYLLVRLLAYCLEYTEGIALSAGLSDPDSPALAVRDLTGSLCTWIDVGAPDGARLHRASKAAPRVVVYTHRDPAHLRRQLSGIKIHRAAEIEVYAIDPTFLAELASRLERRTALTVSVTDKHVFINAGPITMSTAIVRSSAVA